MPSYCKVCGEMMKGTTCNCGGRGENQKADSFQADGNAPVHTQWTDAYVSAGLSNVNDGLRRMLDLHPEWVDKDCCKCGKPCTEGALEGPVGPDLGKAFCKPCFDKNFAKGSCGGCHQPVYGFGGEQFVKHEGKVFHNQCFNEERRCHTCRKPIFGNAVNALGSDYHEACFQCGKCQGPFKGASFCDFKGVPYCASCFDESSKNQQQTKSKTVAVNNPLSNDLNQKVEQRKEELAGLRKFQHIGIGDKCCKCDKDILSNGITSGVGDLYHLTCFVCVSCGSDFPDMTFVEENHNLYHQDCYTKLTAERCGGCHQPITKGKQIQYEGLKYHSDCFKCTKCSKGLAGVPFGENGGKVYCEGCLPAQTNQVSHGEYKPGFTVNPMSGQKEQRGTGGTKIAPTNTGSLGSGKGCPGCSKQVYMAEQAQGPLGAMWHKTCLKCQGCSKQLDSMANVKGNIPYCRDCFKKA